MNNEIKFGPVMASESFCLWLSSSKDESCLEETYSEVQTKDNPEENSNLASGSLRNSNKSFHKKDNKIVNDISAFSPFKEVRTNLLPLLDDIFSDITIKCGVEIHKIRKRILVAISPVFEDMLSGSQDDNLMHVIVIDEFDPEIIRDMVDFIYGREIQNLSMSKACELLSVAEKYQLQKLKDICCDYLGPILINLELRKELPYLSNSTFIRQKIARDEMF